MMFTYFRRVEFEKKSLLVQPGGRFLFQLMAVNRSPSMMFSRGLGQATCTLLGRSCVTCPMYSQGYQRKPAELACRMTYRGEKQNKKPRALRARGHNLWRRSRDSNSGTVSRRRFSRPLPSATRPPLRNEPNYKHSRSACKAHCRSTERKNSIRRVNVE